MVTLQFESRLLIPPFPDGLSIEDIDQGPVILQVPAGRSVNQILDDLEIKLSQAVAAVVNGQTTDLEQPLKSGDYVRLLPQIAGGD